MSQSSNPGTEHQLTRSHLATASGSQSPQPPPLIYRGHLEATTQITADDGNQWSRGPWHTNQPVVPNPKKESQAQATLWKMPREGEQSGKGEGPSEGSVKDPAGLDSRREGGASPSKQAEATQQTAADDWECLLKTDWVVDKTTLPHPRTVSDFGQERQAQANLGKMPREGEQSGKGEGPSEGSVKDPTGLDSSREGGASPSKQAEATQQYTAGEWSDEIHWRIIKTHGPVSPGQAEEPKYLWSEEKNWRVI